MKHKDIRELLERLRAAAKLASDCGQWFVAIEPADAKRLIKLLEILLEILPHE